MDTLSELQYRLGETYLMSRIMSGLAEVIAEEAAGLAARTAATSITARDSSIADRLTTLAGTALAAVVIADRDYEMVADRLRCGDYEDDGGFDGRYGLDDVLTELYADEDDDEASA